MSEVTYSAEQIEQLLKCPVCLDRYKDPKILPCQHTFCRSPCLEGLIDMMSRKIKCPECRKEHFVPYGGSNGFPTNITVSGFLDLPSQVITPRPSDQSTELDTVSQKQCQVCEQDADRVKCFHCDKMLCLTCKDAHLRQAKLDIGRLINQIRRGIPKLSKFISSLEQRSEQNKQHVEGVKSEIHDIIERYIKELHEREKLLISELETFLQGEQRTVHLEQETVEVELASIASYCDSTESLLSRSDSNIPEADILGMKQQCAEYMQQIRRAETETLPESRQANFHFESQALHSSILHFGELSVATPSTSGNGALQGTQVAHGEQRSRAQWLLPQPLHASYFRDADVSSPTLTERSQSYAGSTGTNTQNPSSNRARWQRSQSISESQPSSFMGGQESPRATLPPAPDINGRYADYMYRLTQGSNGYRAGDTWGRTSRGTPSALFSMEPRDQERTSGFFMGGVTSRDEMPVRGMVSSTAGETTAGANQMNNQPTGRHVSVRPPDAFVIMIDENTNRQTRGGNRNQRANRTSLRRTRRARNTSSVNETTQTATGNGSDNIPEESMETAGANADDRPQIERSGTFVMEDSRADGSNVPTIGNQSVSYSIALDETISDVLFEDTNNTVNFRLSTGDSLTVAEPFNNYQRKGSMQKKIGAARGTNVGSFTWPRGVAASASGNRIYVADSSNHRVQIFAQNGQFLHAFGSYGQGNGEFDCLAGIAVSPSGEIITADRYNHRIQIFDRRGRYQRKFGREGHLEGYLNHPWGLAADVNGFVYVCDKGNHRIQVFGHDGTFIRQFGARGMEDGQFDNPHYIAVNSEDKIIVSDTNNHRIQIFTNTGRHVRSFGLEGSGEGELKFPRGVAVDNQGFIIVADSGNSRVQFFRADGRYFCEFGSWGVDDGQMKGLEGITLLPNGNIVVCDKENHRIQIF